MTARPEARAQDDRSPVMPAHSITTRLATVLAAGMLSACVPALPAPDSPDGAAPIRAATTDDATEAHLPVGYGTLRQDAISIAMTSGPVQLRLTPLEEDVIRLAAPDSYERLHALAESRRAEAERATPGGEAVLFLVTFFSQQPDARFHPEDLSIEQQGRLHRPRAIFPLPPDWGTQRLRARVRQNAVYIFDAGLDLGEPFTVRYETVRNEDWARILDRLRIETARVRARAG